MSRLQAVLILTGLLLAAGCSQSENEPHPSGPTIAVIPKGTTHSYWRSVEAGAKQAGKDLSVQIIWKGPLKENDRAMQIALVEQFVTQGIDGIALAPLDETALLRPVREAAAHKIPVVIFDSGLKGQVGKDFISFVATNNYAGGQLAGKEMVDLLNGKGKVVVLRYQVGSASTEQREKGFLDVTAQHPGVQILSQNQYGGATSGESLQKAEEMLDTLRQADGIFCPNESTTYGMLVALRKHNLAGHVRFVGFDSSEELIRGLENGEIDALVVQNPRKMGYLAVKTLVDYLHGQKVPERIDTGVELVTKANLQEPAIQELVKPVGE
jgi:ribose transport system substrate-binding protein